MTKISDSYRSLARGVSQQSAERRLDGQHTEQINMVSDPVRGLTRRQGSVLVRESLVSSTAGALSQLAGYVSRDVNLGTDELTVLYNPTSSAGPALPFYVFNRATGQRLSMTTDSEANLRDVLLGGVGALTAAGRFLLLAGNSFTTQSASSPTWGPGTTLLPAGFVWIKGGAYSRKYTVKLRLNGVDYSWSYTTPTSSYQGELDTSDIPPYVPDPSDPTATIPNPDYTRLVNERVNAYNEAVTKWAGQAMAAIQPDAIAMALMNNAPGLLVGKVVLFYGAGHLGIVPVSGFSIDSLSADDGGDGSLVVALVDQARDVSGLTSHNYDGRVVRISPIGSTSYYVKAVGEDRPGVTTIFQKVRWEETGADTRRPTVAFVIAAVQGGQLYASVTPAGLQGIGVPDVPGFGQRNAGDVDSNPAPYWLGKAITYLGFFQDRLVIGSGPVVSFSKVGDYFNFFKDSALTTVDSDAAEGYAVGSDSDVIRRSVIFDKSLLLFGDRQQYSVSGRVPVTPKTLTIMQSSAHSDATLAPPITAGDLVFYAKTVEDATQVFQIQVGNVDDTSNSAEITQQLDNYIAGRPVQMVGLSLPDCVVVRSTGKPNSIFMFRYIDQGQERLLDSWSRWDFAPIMGKVVGLSVHKGMLRVLFARGSGSNAYVAFEELSVRGVEPNLPHLDSLRPMTSGWDTTSLGTALACAFPAKHALAALQGDNDATKYAALLSDFPGTVQANLWAGVPFESSVTLTSPVMRDRNGSPILTGRTSVQSLAISYDNTSGIAVDVAVKSQGTSTVLTFNSRVVSSLDNLVGVIPLAQGRVPAFIGRENSRYEATIKSRQWLPMTITGVDWVGQFFNNTRRAA